MTSLAAELRRKISKGPVLGSLLLGRDPAFVEVYAAAGWDFVIADCEHGLQDQKVLLEFHRAAEASGVALLVRWPVEDLGHLTPILDAGLAGVLLADASCGEGVAAAVARMFYGPQGGRSLNPFVRAAGYGKADAASIVASGDRPIIWTMAEQAGEYATDDLFSAPGLEGALVGPYDLSVAAGYPGNVEHPEVQALIAGIFRIAGERGLTPGIFTRSAEAAAHYLDVGARMVVVGVDLDLMRRHLASVRASVFGLDKEAAGS